MTWTITMNAKEIARKTELDRAQEGRITQKETSLRLSLSERQVRRLMQAYQREGVSAFVSKKRGRPSNCQLDKSKREAVLTFIKEDQTRGVGPTFMAEKLEVMKGIKLSKETIRKYMIEAGVWKARTRKKVVPHYARERRHQRGELVQIDGSYHAWLEERGPKACLLVFVDDATSEILAAEFVTQESYFAYGNLCKRYSRQIGLPLCFYSDRFSVFRDNHKERVVDEPATQFQRAVSGLDIELVCANSPQAKGRVERANQTLQDRLIKEMRLLGISDYEEANLYLPEFIQDYNARFAVSPISDLDCHCSLDPELDLDFLFSVHDFRIISATLLIQFNNKTYQVLTSHPPYFYVKQEVLLTMDSKGTVSGWFHGDKLDLKLIENRPKQAAVVSSKSASLPLAYNHPWRTYGKKLNGTPVLSTLSSD